MLVIAFVMVDLNIKPMVPFSPSSSGEEMILYEDGVSASIAMSKEVLEIHGGGIHRKASSSTKLIVKAQVTIITSTH